MVWSLLYNRDGISTTVLSHRSAPLKSPLKEKLASGNVLSWQLLAVEISHYTTAFRGHLSPGCSRQWLTTVGVLEQGPSCPMTVELAQQPSWDFPKAALPSVATPLNPLSLPLFFHRSHTGIFVMKAFPAYFCSIPFTDTSPRKILQFCHAACFTEYQDWS